MYTQNTGRSYTQCRFPKGFTLIELLVVVLIIGILAAVAVPQYQKAVMKSKYHNLIVLGRVFADAEEVHYLEHGNYTTEVSELNIDLPATPTNIETLPGKYKLYRYDNFYLSLVKPEVDGAPRVIIANDDLRHDWLLKYDNTHATYHPGMHQCVAFNTLAHEVCKQESGLSAPNVGNNAYIYY